MMLDEVECPFCGEPGEVEADYDPDATGDQVFVQDCAVCCNPWTVTVRVSADGEITVHVGR
ncbi:MAG TPA: CPXCG motif-containing cysteine-rich protein [Polyangia bacterium]|nr:CPXCG motif-containing cysteine-rich protein [Polyangia bacterium]